MKSVHRLFISSGGRGFFISLSLCVPVARYILGDYVHGIEYILDPLFAALFLKGLYSFRRQRMKWERVLTIVLLMYFLKWLSWVARIPPASSLSPVPRVLIVLGWVGTGVLLSFSFRYFWRQAIPVALRNMSCISSHRQIKDTVVSFFVFYLSAIVIFGMCYTTIYQIVGSTAFEARNQLSLPTFLYFSAVTITTLGYGDIRPVHGLARLLSIVEVLVGTGLAVVYVGATISVLGQNREATTQEGNRNRRTNDTRPIDETKGSNQQKDSYERRTRK